MKSRPLSAAARLVVVGVLFTAACARPFPPPGGDRPEIAPEVLEVTPAPLAVEPGFSGPVIFRFNRRISERLPANPVIVSPATGEVRVRRGRSDIRVTIEGGWRPGQIYRVVLLPGVADLFNNATTEPIELVFSTGPAIPATAVAGLVTDRLTGRPARNALVTAVRQADSLVYVAPADTGGFFSLRHLPEGEYAAQAFADLNRNRRRDPAEPVSGAAPVSLSTATDTVPLLLAVLPPDTTPAVLARATPLDSMYVELHFDDFFDPDDLVTGATVELWLLPDSTPVPAGLLVRAAVGEESRAATAAAAAAAAAAADTAQAPPRPTVAAATPQEPLPERELMLVLAVPLQPEAEYRVTVTGVTNIAGIPGGGGTATFRAPARPEPAPAPTSPPPDTARSTGAVGIGNPERARGLRRGRVDTFVMAGIQFSLRNTHRRYGVDIRGSSRIRHQGFEGGTECP